MGLAHDRYDTCRNNSCPPTSYPYAFGYVNQEAFESGRVVKETLAYAHGIR